MNAVFAWIALSLVGTDIPLPIPPSASGGGAAKSAVPLMFQVNVVEIDGLGWRAKHYAKLTNVTDQAVNNVWTAPGSVATSLIESAATAAVKVKMVVESEKFAHINQKPCVNNDSPDRSSSTSQPSRTKREGIRLTMNGRQLDQGVLVKIAVEETKVVAVHSVPIAPEKEGGSQGSAVEVPEIANADVAGEWLIPRNGVLIVSLGTHTVADASSKAVVKERLALIQASSTKMPEQGAGANQLSQRGGIVHSFSATEVTVPASLAPTVPFLVNTAGLTVPMPLPPLKAIAPLPSRSLPEPLDKNGNKVPLPPLPVEPLPPTTLAESSEVCGTPQIKPAVEPQRLVKGSFDPNAAPVAFVPPIGVVPPIAPIKAPVLAAKKPVDANRRFLFRIQLMPNFTLSVVVDPQARNTADAPLPPLVPTGESNPK